MASVNESGPPVKLATAREKICCKLSCSGQMSGLASVSVNLTDDYAPPPATGWLIMPKHV